MSSSALSMMTGSMPLIAAQLLMELSLYLAYISGLDYEPCSEAGPATARPEAEVFVNITLLMAL